MQTVYDKQGNAHQREPVDAREMVATGEYFMHNPTLVKQEPQSPATVAEAGAGGEGSKVGGAGAGGGEETLEQKAAAAGIKPIDEITVAEIRGQLDERNIAIPVETKKKADLYALLVNGQ